MATITPTLYGTPDDRTKVYTWNQINADDTGGDITVLPQYADKTLIIQGTVNGSALTLHCSMDGSVFVPAVDAAGDAVSLAAAGSVVVGSNALYYRLTSDKAGSTEDIDAYLICVRG